MSIETPNRYKKAAEKPDRRQADRVAGKGRKCKRKKFGFKIGIKESKESRRKKTVEKPDRRQADRIAGNKTTKERQQTEGTAEKESRIARSIIESLVLAYKNS